MSQIDITINESLKEHLNEAEQISVQVLSSSIFKMIQQELPKQISSNISIQSIILSNTSLKSIKTNDLVPAMLIKGTDKNTKKVPFLFLCKQSLVRHCINQIMGLENSPQSEIKFDEFDMSAASEMMNVLFQQAARQVSEVANKEINGLLPNVGLFKNFGDFLQTLRLTSDAPITQIHFDIQIGEEAASPCLIVMDFKAVRKFIDEIGPLTMNIPSEPINVVMEEPIPTVVPEPIEHSSNGNTGGILSQDAIEAMLAEKAVGSQNSTVSEVKTSTNTTVIPTSSPSSGGVMSQDAIEAMLAKKAAESQRALSSEVKTSTSTTNTTAIPTSSLSSGGVMSQDAIEAMLAKQTAEKSVSSKAAPMEPKRSIATLHNGSNETKPNQAQSNHIQELPFVEEPQTFFSVPMIQSNMDLVMNVPLTISVEIGNTKKKIKEILDFQPGTVIELEKQHNSPMDVIVNGELFARGEVVVIEENFGVRLTEINAKLSSGNQ